MSNCLKMKGCLTRHAFYIRFVKNDNGKEELSVLRVICSVCEKSHAILLDSIVPYSQTLMKDQIQIIMNFEEDQ